MSWDEFDDVQVREYMSRVEFPEFLKANMEEGDVWDGRLDKWKKYLSVETPNRTIKMVTMNDEQRAETKRYIQTVNAIIYKDVCEMMNRWELPELVGTPKQIAWAKELRQHALESLVVDELRHQLNEYGMWHYIESFRCDLYTEFRKENTPNLRYEEERKAFFTKILKNFVEEFPELAAYNRRIKEWSFAQRKYSTEEKSEAKERLYEKVMGTIPTFNQAKVWIEYKGKLPIDLAALRYLARGEKLDGRILSIWDLSWYEE